MTRHLESESLELSVGVDTGVPAAGEGAQTGSLPRSPSAATLTPGLTGEGLRAGGVLVVLQF